jgi:hypothetical protein
VRHARTDRQRDRWTDGSEFLGLVEDLGEGDPRFTREENLSGMCGFLGISEHLLILLTGKDRKLLLVIRHGTAFSNWLEHEVLGPDQVIPQSLGM